MHHAVIMGCPRSGSSILGELFEYLPGYQYMFEPEQSLVEKWFQDNPTGHVAVKFPKGTPSILGCPCDWTRYWGVSRKPLQVIWIVRDPRDCVPSLLPGTISNWKLGLRPGDDASVVYDGDENWQGASNTWNVVNSKVWNHILEISEQVPHVVRYEELVGKTDEVVRELLSLLEYEESVDIVPYCERVTNFAGVSEAAVQTIWTRRVHSIRVGRWRQHVHERHLKIIRNTCSVTAKKFGYDVESF